MQNMKEAFGDLYKVGPLANRYKGSGEFGGMFLTPSAEQRKRSEELSSFVIGTEFRVILCILSFFGNSPLRYNRRKGLYEFQWLSIKTLLSCITTSVAIFAWIAYIFDFALKKPILATSFRGSMNMVEMAIKSEETLPPVLKTVLCKIISLMFMIMAMTQIWEMFCGWKQSKKLAVFLNTWEEFRVAFNGCFSPPLLTAYVSSLPRGNCSFEQKKNFFFFKMKVSNFLTVSLVFILTLGAVIVTLTNNQIQSSNLLYFFYVLLRLMTLSLVEDVKTVYMCKNVIEAFGRIHVGILYTISSKKRLSSNEVKAWRDLLHIVRRQCVLAGEYQAPGQLGFYISVIIHMTSVIFIFLNVPTGNPILLQFTISWGLYAFVVLFRLYVKVWLAEGVPFLESKIANELSQIDASLATDSNVLMQVKFTHDLISQNKSEVRFGNYVTLNKGLLLSMFNQVVTYLIVIMQFTQNT